MLTKEALYQQFIQQTEGLLQGEQDMIANMANFSALYFETFAPHWAGFYLVKGDELVLGPFQGPVACTRIAFGKGVCGVAWKENTTQIVDNVHAFEGHIACSAHSNSEIVLPFYYQDNIFGVFDVDATEFANYDNVDKTNLEKALNILSKACLQVSD